MSEKLKPCKKCGYARLTKGTEDSDGIIYWQWYVVCDCRRNNRGFETQAEAIEAWNRRADDGD